jgi:hypothetical protein
VTCPRCHTAVAPGTRFCAACGHALSTSEAPTISTGPDEPATGWAADAATAAAPPRTPSTSGWLTSSGSIDHGRFAPGAMLDSRYRVVGLLGRGGMGEVYRADDLRLGQTVALKFLPPDLGRDSVRLAQFHNEVRTARQVSHANVCRVYDIGEVDRLIYLSMEYVDGEDLASLLRRIGRLPEDKAIEIARQICAGLAAAHDRGIIHRDLKPANIMLDGSGRARIMDFSLAAVGTATDVRSGTPAYMAPEQLAGQDVTAKSDLYALGLVLYELFTGRRAFEARTLGDLIEERASGSLTTPTTLVKTLDPAIERAILRCLEPDPARRPPTALAVAAALPGGDPLAAALAAGETPSPEMVAAVGGDAAAVTPLVGLAWVAATALCLLAAGALSSRVSLLAKTPFAKPAVVLMDRAEEIRQALGYTDPPADRASGFAYNTTYLNWAAEQGAGPAGWAVLRSGRPAAVRFWYRTSPGPLVPLTSHGLIRPTDPPVSVGGMTVLDVDTLGRLLAFEAVPPEVDPPPAAPPQLMDWTLLFTAAGLDRTTFVETPAGRTPPTFADERRAWTGSVPASTIAVRLEAAAYRGRLVYFQIVAPWTQASRDLHTAATSQQDSAFSVVAVVALLVVAAFRARTNLRSGRADRRGAIRTGIFAVLLLAGVWACLDHVRDIAEERTRLFDGLGIGLFVGGAMFVVYLALEPEVRRSWPTMLVSWSRVVAGRVRDALVGRDLLIGTAAGSVYAMLNLLFPAIPGLHRGVGAIPVLPDLTQLMGVRPWLLSAFTSINSGFQNGLLTVLIVVLLRELVRAGGARLGRRGSGIDRLATVFAVAVMVVISAVTGSDWSTVIYASVTTALELLVVLRIGLFAGCTMYFVRTFLERVPFTLDSNQFYASEAWLSMAIVMALALVGFWLARAEEPLFGRSAA